jgi:phasin family protein
MATKAKSDDPTAPPPEAASTTTVEPAIGFEQTVAALKDSVTEVTQRIETTQASFNEGVQKMIKTTEEFVAFNQGNLEAVVKSGQIWFAGVQDLSRQVAATAQASFEQGLANFKAMTAVKSFKEAVELQSNLTRSAVEKTLSESSKLTDASLKLTEQTFAPLAARVTLAVEKFSTRA